MCCSKTKINETQVQVKGQKSKVIDLILNLKALLRKHFTLKLESVKCDTFSAEIDEELGVAKEN